MISLKKDLGALRYKLQATRYTDHMIRHISGKILEKDARFVVIEAGSIGYQVFATDEILRPLKENAEVKLWIYHVVREDAEELYGFEDQESLSLFSLLRNVPGIGPRSALNVLNVVTADTLRRSITSNETAYLTKISGIGRKTAEKIVLELREKLGAEEGGATLVEEVDTLEALKALGYSHTEVRSALRELPKEITNTSDRVKHALKLLGKKR